METNKEQKSLEEDKLKKRVIVKEEINTPPKEGYISLPDKLPLSLVVGWLVQFVAMVIGGTLFYSEIKTELMLQKKEIHELEMTVDTKLYTKTEAQLRNEFIKTEMEKMRAELRAKE